MKIKSKKTLLKRYSLSHPKHGKAKVLHEIPGFSHGSLKKRKFRLFRGKIDQSINNSTQAKKITDALS